MEGTYDVLLGSQKMGSVEVSKDKLYWDFVCRCEVCGEVMYDLMVQIGNMRIKLGLLTPEGECFGLRTRLPIKRFEKGNPKFTMQPRHEAIQGDFLPVDPNAPFCYLHRLECAYLARRGEQIGVKIRKEK